MSDLSNLRDIIALWPSRADLLAEMKSACPELRVSIHQVNKWAETGAMRALYHQPFIVAAQRRGFPVTAELIVRLHGPQGRVMEGPFCSDFIDKGDAA